MDGFYRFRPLNGLRRHSEHAPIKLDLCGGHHLAGAFTFFIKRDREVIQERVAMPGAALQF